jgi:hypothetical protein
MWSTENSTIYQMVEFALSIRPIPTVQKLLKKLHEKLQRIAK